MCKNAKKISSFSRLEISELFKTVRPRIKCSGLRILTGQISSDRPGKILIVTSRKTGNAPERNLFRRRLKAIFREHKFYKKNILFLVIATKEGVQNSFTKILHLMQLALTTHENENKSSC